MTGRPSAELADRLALAITEHGPASGTELARRVGARKATVLRALRSSPQFELVGGGRCSSWRLAGTEREPLHGLAEVGADQDVPLAVAEAMAPILTRLVGIERRLAELEHAGMTPHGTANGEVTS